MKKTTLLIAIALLAFACAVLAWRVGSFSSAVITHGTVSQYEAFETDNGTSYRMHFTYMDYNDEEHESETMFQSGIRLYDVGAAIPVEYDRSNPFDATPIYMHPVNSWGLIWAAITTALSLLLIPLFSRKPQRILDEKCQHARAAHKKNTSPF